MQATASVAASGDAINSLLGDQAGSIGCGSGGGTLALTNGPSAPDASTSVPAPSMETLVGLISAKAKAKSKAKAGAKAKAKANPTLANASTPADAKEAYRTLVMSLCFGNSPFVSKVLCTFILITYIKYIYGHHHKVVIAVVPNGILTLKQTF
jgi:hypothetical protein